MKKIITICIALLLGLSMIACTNNQESSVEQEDTNQEVKVSQEENIPKEDGKSSIENYAKLIGLSREEIIDAMGEEPNVIDEGGLGFPNAKINVWFEDDGKTVGQIFIGDSDVDFNGAKTGGNIEDFKNIFGEPVLEEMRYMNFDYKGLVLNVNYDPSTQKVVAVYLMKEWI